MAFRKISTIALTPPPSRDAHNRAAPLLSFYYTTNAVGNLYSPRNSELKLLPPKPRTDSLENSLDMAELSCGITYHSN